MKNQPAPVIQTVIVRGVSPRANALLKSANKWLRRLDERRDTLPKSFFRSGDPRPLRKAITKFLA
jgi:hypothetical protein